jgi:hypothetical protein
MHTLKAPPVPLKGAPRTFLMKRLKERLRFPQESSRKPKIPLDIASYKIYYVN